MKELFQMLNDPRFHLLYGVTQRFSTGPEPRLVRLNREGFKLVEGVTKKTLVHPRMRLAVHPSPLKGDAFSPIFGRICEINERSIFVRPWSPTRNSAWPPKPWKGTSWICFPCRSAARSWAWFSRAWA